MGDPEMYAWALSDAAARKEREAKAKEAADDLPAAARALRAAARYLGERAKREVQQSALRRLETLDDMFRQLVHQAQQIISGAERDLRLHDIPLHAAKIRGKTYHLFERLRDGRRERFLSILSREEYASADPTATYLASYRLDPDSSWARVDAGTEATVNNETFRTYYYYDSLNRLETEINNLLEATDYRYDSRDNLVAVADAKGPSSTPRDYHRRGDVSIRIEPAGRSGSRLNIAR